MTGKDTSKKRKRVLRKEQKSRGEESPEKNDPSAATQQGRNADQNPSSDDEEEDPENEGVTFNEEATNQTGDASTEDDQLRALTRRDRVINTKNWVTSIRAGVLSIRKGAYLRGQNRHPAQHQLFMCVLSFVSKPAGERATLISQKIAKERAELALLDKLEAEWRSNLQKCNANDTEYIGEEDPTWVLYSQICGELLGSQWTAEKFSLPHAKVNTYPQITSIFMEWAHNYVGIEQHVFTRHKKTATQERGHTVEEYPLEMSDFEKEWGYLDDEEYSVSDVIDNPDSEEPFDQTVTSFKETYGFTSDEFIAAIQADRFLQKYGQQSPYLLVSLPQAPVVTVAKPDMGLAENQPPGQPVPADAFVRSDRHGQRHDVERQREDLSRL